MLCQVPTRSSGTTPDASVVGRSLVGWSVVGASVVEASVLVASEVAGDCDVDGTGVEPPDAPDPPGAPPHAARTPTTPRAASAATTLPGPRRRDGTSGGVVRMVVPERPWPAPAAGVHSSEAAHPALDTDEKDDLSTRAQSQERRPKPLLPELSTREERAPPCASLSRRPSTASRSATRSPTTCCGSP